MLLIFNPNKTYVRNGIIVGINSTQLSPQGAFAPQSIMHFDLEIEKQNYDTAKHMLNEKSVKIENLTEEAD